MLGRVADQAGYDYWPDETNNGLAQFGLVRWVVASDEFVANYLYLPKEPGNPGDSKNCSDFETQAKAQAWCDHYCPQLDNVSKLDQDDNFVPCESL